MVILGPLLELVLIVLNLYMYVIFASVIMSWLYAFNVINSSNRVVYLIGDFLYRATEPALRPLRRFIPNLGGIDLAPLALLLIVFFLQRVLTNVAFEMGAFR